MSDRIALDTNAVIAVFREDRTSLPQVRDDSVIVLPLPVIGELFAGAYSSKKTAQNLAEIEIVLKQWIVLVADLETARIYGRLRGNVHVAISPSHRNDLWIAALCLQYDLPLLTNDRGFDAVPGLTVVHWQH